MLDPLARATRGGRRSTALGETALHMQLALGQADDDRHAVDVMASSSRAPSAQRGSAAFPDGRAPTWAEQDSARP